MAKAPKPDVEKDLAEEKAVEFHVGQTVLMASRVGVVSDAKVPGIIAEVGYTDTQHPTETVEVKRTRRNMKNEIEEYEAKVPKIIKVPSFAVWLFHPGYGAPVLKQNVKASELTPIGKE